MRDKFLCYEAGSFLFLFPMEEVRYIMPAGKESQGDEFTDDKYTSVFTVDLNRSLLSAPSGQGIHTLLLECETDYYAVTGGHALEAVEAPRESWKKLPEKLAYRQVKCLKAGIFLESRGQWAYIVDTRRLCEAEGTGHE